jgi:cytochrome c5
VNKTDLTFLKHFAMVIGGLMLLTLVLIAGASWIYSDHLPQPSTISAVKTAARIAPVGDVYAGATGESAMAAAKAAAAAAAQAQVAYEGTLDGNVIYGKLCSACHASGAGGAPQLTQALWSPRIAQGMDMLVKHAVEGYQGQAGVMPARGGNPSLSDDQVKATVQWMVDNVK